MKITYKDALNTLVFYYDFYTYLKKEYGEENKITKNYEEIFKTKIVHETLEDIYNEIVELTNDDSSKLENLYKDFAIRFINQNK